MKVLNKEEMMTWLKGKGVRVVGTSAQFYNDNSNGIWVSGECSDLFDYYRESWYNTHGVSPKLNEQTEKRGWYYEWHDTGTMMLWQS
jgi:hypothetical protein